jgi:hypothetical protein
MPMVNGKKYSYTESGIKKATKAAKEAGKKKKKNEKKY